MKSAEEKFLSNFLTTISGWESKVVIGGGFALIIYRNYFSQKDKTPIPVGTRDLDTLISRNIKVDQGERNLSEILTTAGFELKFKDHGSPATEAYFKNIDGSEFEVEFLTDKKVRQGKEKNAVIAGVTAQPLSFLELSLREVIEFHTDSGQKGQVVSPAAWVFHKSLAFPRRSNSLKKMKDLYGIWYVCNQMGSFSTETQEAFLKLRDSYTAWGKKSSSNLKKFIKNLSPENKKILEQQDPNGFLDADKFIFWVKSIT